MAIIGKPCNIIQKVPLKLINFKSKMQALKTKYNQELFVLEHFILFCKFDVVQHQILCCKIQGWHTLQKFSNCGKFQGILIFF